MKKLKDMSGRLSGGMENDVAFQMGQLAAAIRLAKDEDEALALLKRWHKENPVGKRVAALDDDPDPGFHAIAECLRPIAEYYKVLDHLKLKDWLHSVGDKCLTKGMIHNAVAAYSRAVRGGR